MIELDVEDLSTGLYLLRVSTPEKFNTISWVKN